MPGITMRVACADGDYVIVPVDGGIPAVGQAPYYATAALALEDFGAEIDAHAKDGGYSRAEIQIVVTPYADAASIRKNGFTPIDA